MNTELNNANLNKFILEKGMSHKLEDDSLAFTKFIYRWDEEETPLHNNHKRPRHWQSEIIDEIKDNIRRNQQEKKKKRFLEFYTKLLKKFAQLFYP